MLFDELEIGARELVEPVLRLFVGGEFVEEILK